MRHRKYTVKLGRTSSQRSALMSSLVSNLILAKRITTTLPKARAAKRMADKMVTIGKKNNLAAKRQALSLLRNESAAKELFAAVAPAMNARAGGYTRIVKLGQRMSDSSEMCILEWVDFVPKAKKAAKGDKAEKAAPKAEKEAPKAEKKAPKAEKKAAKDEKEKE